MKVIETRQVSVTYCDYCNKELKGNFTSIAYESNGLKIMKDFCDEIIEDNKSCLDKHKEENTLIRIAEKRPEIGMEVTLYWKSDSENEYSETDCCWDDLDSNKEMPIFWSRQKR